MLIFNIKFFTTNHMESLFSALPTPFIDDKIDYSVGIYLKKQLGDSVKKGDVLAVLYYNDKLPKIEYNKIFTID